MTVNVGSYVAGVASPPVDLSVDVIAASLVVVERPVYFSADPGVGTVVDGGTIGTGAAG